MRMKEDLSDLSDLHVCLICQICQIIQICRFPNFKKTRDGQNDGTTDGRMDRPSYRDTWTHTKMQDFYQKIFYLKSEALSLRCP